MTGQPPPRRPHLRPTEPATLLVAGLAAAALAWLLISRFYGDLPRLSWLPVIVIAGVALFEAVLAQDTWARVHRRGWAPVRQRFARDSRPLEPAEPLVVARFAVLAKASSLAGAIFAGGYAGFLPWLLVESGRVATASDDLPPDIGGLLASLGLVASAMWLERACRVPKRDGEEDESRNDHKE